MKTVLFLMCLLVSSLSFSKERSLEEGVLEASKAFEVLAPYFGLTPGVDVRMGLILTQGDTTAHAGRDFLELGAEIITALPRDQLWFVVGHELAHIHNEDNSKWRVAANMFQLRNPALLLGLEVIDPFFKLSGEMNTLRFEFNQKTEFDADILAAKALWVAAGMDGCEAAKGLFTNLVGDETSGHGTAQERKDRACK